MKNQNTDFHPSASESRSTNTAGRNERGTPDLRSRPLHEQISERAQQLWQSYGAPSGRDEEIWLEAERQLLGADSRVDSSDEPVLADSLQESSLTRASTPDGGSPRSSESHERLESRDAQYSQGRATKGRVERR